tara:strand:- start:110 stop:307 length:198 start_codon:yes stop_codon:yes gene_type:complete
MDNTTREWISEELGGSEVSECCSAPPAGGLSELGFCGRCGEHTTFYWEVDEQEVEALFNERNSVK